MDPKGKGVIRSPWKVLSITFLNIHKYGMVRRKKNMCGILKVCSWLLVVCGYNTRNITGNIHIVAIDKIIGATS